MKLRRIIVSVIAISALMPLAKGQKFGSDSLQCVKDISLYREYYKQNNFKDAYIPWKSAFDNCPMASKYIVANGSNILDYMIESSKNDSVQREAYIQELFDFFDLRIKYYPEDEAYVLGRVGVYLVKYRPHEYKKAYEALGQSIDLGGKETSPQVLDVYFKISEFYMQKERLDTSILIDSYDKITENMDVMLDEAEKALEAAMRPIYKLHEDFDSGRVTELEFNATLVDRRVDSAKAANALQQLKNANNNLQIRFSKYASCDMLNKIYGKKFEVSKDMRTLNQIVKFFQKANCVENNPLFVAAVEEVHKQAPTAKTAFYMGRVKLEKNQNNEAIDYFKEAMNMYEKESDSITTFLLISIAYQKLGQYSAARDCCYKILKLNPNEARAYIQMGDLYAASGGACSGLEIPRAIYWAAADKYSRAKSLASEPNVAEEAQKKLNTAAARFPETKDYFVYGYASGQPYKVGCWINESTTIR